MGFCEKYFDCKIYMTVWGAMALTIISVLLLFVLPREIAYENGFLENLQVAELLVGAAFSVFLAAKAIEKEERSLWQAAFISFLLIAARELNWGRVFYPTAALNRFLPLKDLWYGPVVYPLVALAAFAIIYLFRRGRFFLFGARRKLPFWNCIFFVSLFLAADYVEHRPLSFFGQSYDGEILEELLECICYLMLIDIVRIMGGKGVKYCAF